MKLLVIGCGSIGKRHIQNLHDMGHDVVACDTNDITREETERSYGTTCYKNVDDAIDKEVPKAVVIATPPSSHINYAMCAARAGCDLFIEKPVAPSFDGIEELIDVIEKQQIVDFVACNMRFHKPIQIARQLIVDNALGTILSARAHFGHYLPNWRPERTYTDTYSIHATEGGILLDCIHEFDYLRWLCGEGNIVCSSCAKVSSLELQGHDLAEITIAFSSGGIAQVHLDYLRHEKLRGLELIGDRGTFCWQSNGKNPERARVTLSTSKKTQVLFDGEINSNKMYIDQMMYFINCIEERNKSINSVASSKNTLELVLRAQELVSNEKE